MRDTYRNAIGDFASRNSQSAPSHVMIVLYHHAQRLYQKILRSWNMRHLHWNATLRRSEDHRQLRKLVRKKAIPFVLLSVRLQDVFCTSVHGTVCSSCQATNTGSVLTAKGILSCCNSSSPHNKSHSLSHRAGSGCTRCTIQWYQCSVLTRAASRILQPEEAT